MGHSQHLLRGIILWGFLTFVPLLHSLTRACHTQVLAEGGSFERDELVVYTNDAIRPSYLVMYDA